MPWARPTGCLPTPSRRGGASVAVASMEPTNSPRKCLGTSRRRHGPAPRRLRGNQYVVGHGPLAPRVVPAPDLSGLRPRRIPTMDSVTARRSSLSPGSSVPPPPSRDLPRPGARRLPACSPHWFMGTVMNQRSLDEQRGFPWQFSMTAGRSSPRSPIS